MFGWFKSKKKAKSKSAAKSSKRSPSKSTATKTAKSKPKRKTSGNYKNWEARREATFERDSRKCRNCGSTRRLQAHHKSYRTQKLVTLCHSCHQKEHGFG